MVVKTVTPLSKRRGDWFFIGFFVFALVIGAVMDIINAIGPAGGYTHDPDTGVISLVTGITPETAAGLAWPPQPVFQAFFWWCKLCDPLLAVNPVWMKFLAFLSPFIYIPFYVYAIHAFVTGNDNVRIPGIMFATQLFNNLVLIFVESIYGSMPSNNVPMFVAGYGPYLLFPLVLGWRLRNANVFTVSSMKTD